MVREECPLFKEAYEWFAREWSISAHQRTRSPRARPMTAGAYCDRQTKKAKRDPQKCRRRGKPTPLAVVPPGEHQKEPGELVTHPDGSEEWLSKEAFDLGVATPSTPMGYIRKCLQELHGQIDLTARPAVERLKWARRIVYLIWLATDPDGEEVGAIWPWPGESMRVGLARHDLLPLWIDDVEVAMEELRAEGEWLPAKWYNKATDGYLNSALLRKARNRKTIRSQKRGRLVVYQLASVLSSYPQCRALLTDAL